MKINQRYLLAKYVPDIRRQEPVNIGVVLWCSGRTVAKFLPTNTAAELVNDLETYERWVKYWGRLLAAETIEPLRGAPIPRSSPEFLEELIRTQKDSYRLVDAGEILDKVSARELDSAASYMFSELVARKTPRPKGIREQGIYLRKACSQVLEAAGLYDRKDFHQGYPVKCHVGSVDQQFRFNYAIADKSTGVRAVFQRVYLSSPQTIYSARFMFEKLMESSGRTDHTRCATLVQLDGATDIPNANSSVEMLKEFSEIVDVSDHDEAVSRIADLTQAI